jgi:hypothetical protein
MWGVRALVTVGALLVGGCAGMSYAVSEYQGISPVPFDVAGDDTYRVFDKPASNKLMITPSIGRAMAMGAGRGITLMAADTSVPKPLYERAALGYLASTGRTNCRIVDGYLVIDPQWEFKYDCSVPPVTEAKPRR